jgi:hypothetical protein
MARACVVPPLPQAPQGAGPSANRYSPVSRAARCALALARPPPGCRAVADALAATRVAGVCEYSGAALAAEEALEVDHCVPLETLQELMWQASLAHAPKGSVLPWDPEGCAWVASHAHAPGNLQAVTRRAHKAKSAAALGYVKALAASTKVRPGRPAGAGVPPAAPHFQLRAAAARGPRVLREDFADLVARHHKRLGVAMRLRPPQGAHRYQLLLAAWVAAALCEAGGFPAQQRLMRQPLPATRGSAPGAGEAEAEDKPEEEAAQ